MRLDGRTALVTGGSRGIGRGICQRLAADGAHVLVHYGTNHEAAEATVAEIRAAGGSAAAVPASLGGPEPEDEAKDLISRVGSGGGSLDVVVNNAGVAEPRGTIENTDAAGLQRLFAVNAVAPFFITKYALDLMTEGGRIINVSAHLTRGAGQPDLIGYAMSKAAIDTFTSTLAKDVASRGITVNAVAPGVVDTDMNSAWLGHARDFVAGLSPLGRVADAPDVAGIVAFLASDDSRWITGQRLDASGGALL